AGAHSHARARVLLDRIVKGNVESIIHGGSWALAECRRPNRLRLAKQNQGSIDQVRSEIPQNPGRGMIGILAPCAGLGIEAEAVEARFILDHRAELAGSHKLLHSLKNAVPATILINGD